ncbi:MAG: response regulator, partial [Candidatus Omnitrophota bacterium]
GLEKGEGIMEKVLIVEDEKMVADVISNFFKRKGLKVDIAYDLSTGMEKFNPEYDMVLLDIALGEERSFPLLERIKKECPDMPVLMFSGYDSDENIREAKRLGANGFIPKPFRIEFLDDFLIPKIESIRKQKEKKE